MIRPSVGGVSVAMAQSDISVVGEAENRESGIELFDQLLPDLVVLDIRLNQDSGIEVAKKLRAYAHWLVSASRRVHLQGEFARRTRRGHLRGDGRRRSAHAKGGQQSHDWDVRSGDVRGNAEPVNRRADPARDRSDRADARGQRNQGTAEHLAISPRTVESHVARIMAKLNATSRTEAIRIATEIAIIT